MIQSSRLNFKVNSTIATRAEQFVLLNVELQTVDIVIWGMEDWLDFGVEFCVGRFEVENFFSWSFDLVRMKSKISQNEQKNFGLFFVDIVEFNFSPDIS